jgi:hypothetical protein
MNIMEISPEEAQEALEAVKLSTTKMRHVQALGAVYQVAWGLVWFFGFLVCQFVPAVLIGPVLVAMLVVGMLSSMVLGLLQGRRQGERIRATPGSGLANVGARIGLFFAALTLYSLVWLLIAQPLHAQQVALLWITFVMFGYVVTGTWLRLKPLIGIGVAVTLLSLPGYYLLPQFFWLWLAISSGAILTGTGISILRR